MNKAEKNGKQYRAEFWTQKYETEKYGAEKYRPEYRSKTIDRKVWGGPRHLGRIPWTKKNGTDQNGDYGTGRNDVG